nr:putative ribonuclease H-like domain-containing protein [Tanacetum cinerariifolium]
VTKPHHKTPYELLTGDKPSISYLKPFRCHVTILNTSDPLGKFDKKSDEGSHEDDLDSDDEPDVLIIHSTPTPVVPIIDEATTQNDGTKSDHATTNVDNLGELTELQALQRKEQERKEEADQLGLAFPSLNLILGVGSTPIGSSVSASSTPPVSACSTPPMSPCASPISAGRPVSAGTPTGSVGRPVSTGIPVSAGKSTGSAVRPVSAGRPSGSAARTPIPADIHDGLKIFDCPKSGIFTSSSYDEEFSGPDANNLTSSVDVSSTITKGSIIFILLLKYLRRNNHPDFQLCMFSCFLSQEEPTTVAQALADPDWVETMQAAIIETIRLFLAFASFIGFKVYQMDVKSAFHYGKIAEEVYVTQPRGFEDPNHPKKFYKRKKQTIVATSSCEAKYVAAASCCGQGHIGHLWFLFTSAGRVTFCWLFPIPAGDLVSAAQQQEVSLPPPSPVVAPHPSPDPMPSSPSISFGHAPSSGVVSSEPILDIPSSSGPSEPVLETITSPIRGDDTGGGSFHESPPRPPPATPTSSPTVGVAEEPLTLTSLLALFPTCLQRIATLKTELKATKILHRDTVFLFARRIKKLESKLKTKKRKLVLSDSENEEEASELDSAVGRDSAGGVVFAAGVDSADGLISAGVFVAAGPTVPTEPLSPVRDPSKGKAEIKQSLDAEQVYLDSLLAQRVAKEQERESMASAAQLTQRQAELDRVALNLTNEEVQPSILGWTWKDVRSLTDDQLQIVYDKIRRAVDLATAKDHHQHLKRSGKTLESLESKKLKSSHSTKQPAALQETTSVSAGATIAAGDPTLAITSVSAASFVPTGTPIAAGVSTTAGASRSSSEACVFIIELLDSPPKDTSLPLDPETEEHDVPLRKSSRKKSIARRRTLPSPSKSESAALPFDEDDLEAKFKKYLRKVSDDDELAEPVSLALVSDIRRADLMVLYGMVSDKYKIKRATGIVLRLWLDLRTLITAKEDRDASIIWDDQDQWEI